MVGHVIPTHDKKGIFQELETTLGICPPPCICGEPTVFFGDNQTQENICWAQTELVRVERRSPGKVAHLLKVMPEQILKEARELAEENNISTEELIAHMLFEQVATTMLEVVRRDMKLFKGTGVSVGFILGPAAIRGKK